MNNLPRAEIEKICIQYYMNKGYSEADSIAYLSHALNEKDGNDLMRIYTCILKEENNTAPTHGNSLQKTFGQT
ncbi:MAG: hypothetical protein IJX63_12680 [Lachnospiraceae bacterium]|nr:hypothetical protein [Lachnospiraceae bacterium]